MRKTLIFCISVIITSVLFANNTDSLFAELDKAIQEQEIYVKARQSRIDNLKSKLSVSRHDSVLLYSLNKQLYEEYRPFICDSAIYYLNKNIALATEASNKVWKNETTLLLSYLLSSSGMYMEAMEWINSVDKQTLKEEQLSDYYSCYEHIYNEMSLNTHDTYNTNMYKSLARGYKDSVMMYLNPESLKFLEIQEVIYLDDIQFDKAEEINELRLSRATFGTQDYAVVAFFRSLIARGRGDMEEYQKWLILSSISDIKAAIKDNASLCMLADYLYDSGDIDRSYHYIRKSLDDANFYNARLRSYQIASIQSVIDKTFQAKSEQQKARLRISLTFISVLSVLLLFALLYIYRQMRKLAVARDHLKEANNESVQLNEELSEMNFQLQHVNYELSESNHVKEEYIGHFLTLCSTYLDKLDKYRRMVNKRISSGQIQELLKTTKSPELLDAELADFYKNFDTTFLRLYPNFVDEFNALLDENEKIVLKKGELLNTELRIFALIRLGIEDSSKIAELLRYSVNTIYNYRAKAKNKAKVSREDFENMIMKIGTFSQ